jgi:hypothetical protein
MVFSILHFADELSFEAMYNMPFAAPVIGKITGGIFHKPDPEAFKFNSLPGGHAIFARMQCFWN